MTVGAHALVTPFIPVIDGTALGHIASINPNQDVSNGEIRCLGKIDNVDYFVAGEKPKVDFDTYALKQLLASAALNVSLVDGKYCNTGNTLLQYQKAAAAGAFEAANGNHHFKLTSALAWLGIMSIAASQDDTKPATAKCQAHLLRNGSTRPNIAANATTITGTIALADYYSLGPIYINDEDIPGLTTLDLQTGIKFEPVAADGNTIADRGRITERKVSAKCGIENFAALAAYGLGMSVAAGVVDIYLRHVSASGGRNAADEAEHLKITFSAAKILINSIEDAQNGGVTQPVLEILNTGTVSVNTATEIPTAAP